MNTSTKHFSLSNIRKHSSQHSTWIVVHGHVYNCTTFLKDHPGGSDSILINVGTDCTEEFDLIPSEKAKPMLDTYRIGELITTRYTSDTSVHNASNLIHLGTSNEATRAPAVTLSNPREKIHCKLVFKIIVSCDVRLFRFALPSSDQVLGLPAGKHIFICATIDDKLCMHAYMPTSPLDAVGHVDLLIKIYLKGEYFKLPNGGMMSRDLESLSIGSYVDIKGMLGHIGYIGCGNFLVNGKPKFAKKLAMIVGGTGITPLYQVIQAMLHATRMTRQKCTLFMRTGRRKIYR